MSAAGGGGGAAAAAAPPAVALITTAGCPYCKRAKAALQVGGPSWQKGGPQERRR